MFIQGILPPIAEEPLHIEILGDRLDKDRSAKLDWTNAAMKMGVGGGCWVLDEVELLWRIESRLQ